MLESWLYPGNTLPGIWGNSSRGSFGQGHGMKMPPRQPHVLWTRECLHALELDGNLEGTVRRLPGFNIE